MKLKHVWWMAAAAAVSSGFAAQAADAAQATRGNEKLLMDFNGGFDPARVVSGNGLAYEMVDVAEEDGGEDGGRAIRINVSPNGGWPGLNVAIPEGLRDLSAFGGVSVEAHNVSDAAMRVTLRVDNPGADGSKHCNNQSYTLAAGERKTLSTWFGFTEDKPAFALNPANVSGICVFWSQPKSEMELVIDNVRAIPHKPGTRPPAKPRERVAIDFETGAGEEDHALRDGKNAMNTAIGFVTGADAGAIAGRSLAASTYPDGRGWFEFWESRHGLLAGGYTYTVAFRYRILDADENATLYALFRSQSRGWGKWDRGWSHIKELPAQKGADRTLVHTFSADLPRHNDYILMLGIDGKASVVIDDVLITRGAPFDDGGLAELLAAKRNAAAAPHILLDFESADDPIPAHSKLAIGAITDAELLTGKRSLAIDTRDANRTWNEALAIGRGRIEPGYRYHVTLLARMLDKGAKGGGVYIFANPTKQVEGQGKLGWRSWTSAPGDEDVLSTTFEFRQDAGYEFVIGVQDAARVLIDDIEIRREPLPEDRLPLAKVRDKAASKLIFEDTFDAPDLDETKWTRIGDVPRTGGIWRKASSTITPDGHLDLAFKPDGDTFSFGCVETKGKFAFTYGLVEARMKFPKQVGHWPGFWLFGDQVGRVGDGGRDGTEVDIVEAPWRHVDKVTHTLHWDGYGDDHAAQGREVEIPGINEGWHTFAVDWSPDGYIFLVDGVETHRSDAGGVCENPLWIIISDEMGGWSGNPREAKDLPDHTLIDYVRVWQ